MNEFGEVFLTILAVLLVVFVYPLALMWCWNYIMPLLFGLGTITYWQSWVLYILSNILFKNYNYKKND